MRVLGVLLLGLITLAAPEAAAQVRVIRWHTSLESAVSTAKATGKPLFIVFRCVPCAGCRNWDALVASEDKDIALLREEFVCARIPQMDGVDIAHFEHDFDTTWSSYFTDAGLNIYSRYGGRDEVDSESRLSKPALLHTMRDVLDVHRSRLKRGATGADGDTHPRSAESSTPEDIPLLEKLHSGCVHCHEVQEYRLRQAFLDGTFSRSMIFGFPLPESVGLIFNRDHGHQMKQPLPDSAALRAGLQAGDLITRVNNVPIHSEDDIRWAMHRTEDDGTLHVTALRETGQGGPQAVDFDIHPEKNWKQSELGWRKSLRSIPLMLGFLAFQLDDADCAAAGLKEKQLALRVVSLRGPGLAQVLGLAKGDVIVALEDQTKPASLDDFKSNLLRRFEPGDMVQVTVLRDGQRVVLKGPLPDWSLDLSALP